ncbi:hypothetical protein [Nocardioides sp.]|uniref:hypothetical protein n=1 Tax=Nocardioides sp. TaxID=35761 RepID=UPI003D1000DD
MPEEPHTAKIDVLTVLAGALAAITSALVLSTLGAAGTIIGAALGSVTATVGSALYSQGLARSRNRVLLAQRAAARRRPGATRTAEPEAETAPLDEAPDDEARDDESPVDEAPVQPPAPEWGERLRALPWKWIAVVAGVLFVLVIVLITAFELISGRSVASITGGTDDTGGTTISRVTGGRSGNDPSEQPSPSPFTPEDTSSPSDPATTSESAEPTPEDTESVEPTPSETTEPSVTPSESPTP